MARTWSKVLRQILLRGNFFAGDAAATRIAYLTAPLNDSILTRNAAEYPFEAIADGVLQAMTQIVAAIGENRESNFRAPFLADTDPILNGGEIPDVSADGKPRYGLIRNVREYTDGSEDYAPRQLTHQPRTLIDIANRQSPRLSDTVFYYFTDDVRIWHTLDAVVAEIVAWDKEAERSAIVNNNATADCPLPDELLPALEFGSLSFIYRDTFNAENAAMNAQRFAPELQRIAGKPSADAELPSKA